MAMDHEEVSITFVHLLRNNIVTFTVKMLCPSVQHQKYFMSMQMVLVLHLIFWQIVPQRQAHRPVGVVLKYNRHMRPDT